MTVRFPPGFDSAHWLSAFSAEQAAWPKQRYHTGGLATPGIQVFSSCKTNQAKKTLLVFSTPSLSMDLSRNSLC